MMQSPVEKEKKKFTLFGKGETSTVIMLLVFFFIAIVAVQLIMGANSGKIGFPNFISPVNLINIIMQISAVGIMAMGMTVVMIGGGIDLSVGMLVSLVVIYLAKTVMDLGIPMWVAIVTVIIIAILLEVIMGIIISRFAVEPFIITLGGMIAFRGIALLICKSQEISTEGRFSALKDNLISGAKDPVTGLTLTLPIYVLAFFAITIIIWWLMKYTKYGRRVYAVGANRNAAYLAGIDVKNIVLSTYALNGLIVGIAAIMLLSRVNTAIITVGQNLEIDVIAAVVVGGTALAGGKGNIWGTFFGVILMGAIANGMNILRIQSEWQFVAKGVILIVAVAAGAAVQARRARALQLQQIK
ncbi:MAG: ABC transporter permease [Actinobacteria bacterium]|nr:ABC transporter permease [Actinomycetota bacterium]